MSSRASSAHGSASGSDMDDQTSQPLLIASLCGSSKTEDFSVVLRFAVPVAGRRDASENQDLQQLAEPMARKLCKDLREIGLEPPECCGEISLEGIDLLQNVLSRCGAPWRPRLQLCRSVEEEKAAWEQRERMQTICARKVTLRKRTPSLPELTPRNSINAVRNASSSRSCTPTTPRETGQAWPRSRTSRTPRSRSPSQSSESGQLATPCKQSSAQSAEHDTKRLQSRLYSLGTSLIGLQSHLMELTQLVLQDQRSLEEHKYVLQHQFVTLMESTLERERALNELVTESSNWSDQCQLGMIGRAMRGADSESQVVAEDSLAASLLHHFDRSQLALVERALASNTDDVFPKVADQPRQDSAQLLTQIIKEVRSVLVSAECASEGIGRRQNQTVSAAKREVSQTPLDFYGAFNMLEALEEKSKGITTVNKNVGIARSSSNQHASKDVLVLVRRMLWDSSFDASSQYRTSCGSTREMIQTIRKNMASALMSQSMKSMQKEAGMTRKHIGRGSGRSKHALPHCVRIHNRQPEVSAEQDLGQVKCILEDCLTDDLGSDEEGPCELFTIHSDSGSDIEEADPQCDHSDSNQGEAKGSHSDSDIEEKGLEAPKAFGIKRTEFNAAAHAEGIRCMAEESKDKSVRSLAEEFDADVLHRTASPAVVNSESQVATTELLSTTIRGPLFMEQLATGVKGDFVQHSLRGRACQLLFSAAVSGELDNAIHAGARMGTDCTQSSDGASSLEPRAVEAAARKRQTHFQDAAAEAATVPAEGQVQKHPGNSAAEVAAKVAARCRKRVLRDGAAEVAAEAAARRRQSQLRDGAGEADAEAAVARRQISGKCLSLRDGAAVVAAEAVSSRRPSSAKGLTRQSRDRPAEVAAAVVVQTQRRSPRKAEAVSAAVAAAGRPVPLRCTSGTTTQEASNVDVNLCEDVEVAAINMSNRAATSTSRPSIYTNLESPCLSEQIVVGRDVVAVPQCPQIEQIATQSVRPPSIPRNKNAKTRPLPGRSTRPGQSPPVHDAHAVDNVLAPIMRRHDHEMHRLGE